MIENEGFFAARERLAALGFRNFSIKFRGILCWMTNYLAEGFGLPPGLGAKSAKSAYPALARPVAYAFTWVHIHNSNRHRH